MAQRTVSKEDDDAWKRCSVANIEIWPICRVRRAKIVVRLTRQKGTQESLFERLEGIRCICIQLGGVVYAADPIVEDDKATPITALGRYGRCDSLIKVGPTIRADVRVWPHGAGGDKRLGTVEGQVDAKGRLLERVGAVDHDGADNVRALGA